MPQDPDDLADQPHAVGFVECRICGAKAVAVWPVSVVDDTRLQCTVCGHMACEPMEGESL